MFERALHCSLSLLPLLGLLVACTHTPSAPPVPKPPAAAGIVVVEGLTKADFETGPLAELRGQSLWFHQSETGVLPTSPSVLFPVLRSGKWPRHLPWQDEIQKTPNGFERISLADKIDTIPGLRPLVPFSEALSSTGGFLTRTDKAHFLEALPRLKEAGLLLVVTGTEAPGIPFGPALKTAPPAELSPYLNGISYRAAVFQKSLRMWLHKPDFVNVALAARKLGKIPRVDSVYSLKRLEQALHYVLSYQSEASRSISTEDPVNLLDTFKTPNAPDIVVFFEEGDEPFEMPLLLHAPKWISAGSENFQPVSAVDVYPIVREALQLPPPEDVDGEAPVLKPYFRTLDSVLD